MNVQQLTNSIVNSIEPAIAKEFCLFFSAYWDGHQNTVKSWVDRSLTHIGIPNQSLNDILANSILKAMKSKSVSPELRYKRAV